MEFPPAGMNRCFISTYNALQIAAKRLTESLVLKIHHSSLKTIKAESQRKNRSPPTPPNLLPYPPSPAPNNTHATASETALLRKGRGAGKIELLLPFVFKFVRSRFIFFCLLVNKSILLGVVFLISAFEIHFCMFVSRSLVERVSSANGYQQSIRKSTLFYLLYLL